MARNCIEQFLLLSMFILLFDDSLGLIATPYHGSEMDCPAADTKMLTNEVPWGVPFRAHLTIPPELRIAPSTLHDAGLGVISETFIKKYTWLGDYHGDIVQMKFEPNIGAYGWSVRRNLVPVALIDGSPIDRSSYLRFMNMPHLRSQENVISLECYTKIYYMTSKDIAPGTELFIYYGAAYAIYLGIDLNDYFEVPGIWRILGLDLNKDSHRRRIDNEYLEPHNVKYYNPWDFPNLWKVENEKEDGSISARLNI